MEFKGNKKHNFTVASPVVINSNKTNLLKLVPIANKITKMILFHSCLCQHIHLQSDDKVQCTYEINGFHLPCLAMPPVNSSFHIFQGNCGW